MRENGSRAGDLPRGNAPDYGSGHRRDVWDFGVQDDRVVEVPHVLTSPSEDRLEAASTVRVLVRQVPRADQYHLARSLSTQPFSVAVSHKAFRMGEASVVIVIA